MKVVVSVSGGMDSVTMLYRLVADGHEVKAISYNYGQRHFRELEAAKASCSKLGVEHSVIDITSITKFISNSALTGDIEMPEGHYSQDNMSLTVVPSRNTIMLSIANGYAVNLDYDAEAAAVHSGDHAIYPDCRPEFVEALEKLFAVNNYKAIKILTPYLDSSKVGILRDGLSLGVDYANTWTCYAGGEEPCGKCGSCVERTLAFVANDAVDPLYKAEAWEVAKAHALKLEAEYNAKNPSLF